MSTYLIVDVDVAEPDQYETYKREAPRLVEKHGGEYLVRGGEFEVIEGEWKPTRLVVLRFPDRQAVHALFADPEYQPLKALRHRIATSSIVAVDGL
ncbi:MAG: DUF1330 domain-containing protein [Pseudomonadota bacterium]